MVGGSAKMRSLDDGLTEMMPTYVVGLAEAMSSPSVDLRRRANRYKAFR